MNPKKKSRRCRASVSIQALDLAISRFIHSHGPQSYGRVKRGFLGGVRCTKSMREEFLPRRSPSSILLLLYPRLSFRPLSGWQKTGRSVPAHDEFRFRRSCLLAVILSFRIFSPCLKNHIYSQKGGLTLRAVKLPSRFQVFRNRIRTFGTPWFLLFPSSNCKPAS